MQIEYRAPRNIAELNDSIFCSMCAFDCDEGGFSDDHFFSRILKLDPWYDLNNTRACFVDGPSCQCGGDLRASDAHWQQRCADRWIG